MLKSTYLQEADFSSFTAYLQNSPNVITWPCHVDVIIFTLEWGNWGREKWCDSFYQCHTTELKLALGYSTKSNILCWDFGKELGNIKMNNYVPPPLFPRISFFKLSDNPHSPSYKYLMSTYEFVPYHASHQGCSDDWNLSVAQVTPSSVKHPPVR